MDLLLPFAGRTPDPQKRRVEAAGRAFWAPETFYKGD